MNLQNLSTDIAKISQHSSECTGVCQMIEEIRREGLASVFLVQCDKCSKKFHMVSSQKVHRRYAVNIGAVWGHMSTGGGPSSLNETAAALDVPGMPKKTFASTEEYIGRAWEQMLGEEITKAGKEERELALKRNDFFEP